RAPRDPRSYVQALDARALSGARLGVLTTLFGSAPEDQRAGSVVGTALREMERAGARLTVIDQATVPSEADGVAIIRYEFKFDLDDYLRRTRRAPVRSLAEILDKRLALPALEPAFRRSNDIASLDTDEYRAIVARNASLRDALVALMDEQHVTALVYPTLRRTAAKIGEGQ